MFLDMPSDKGADTNLLSDKLYGEIDTSKTLDELCQKYQQSGQNSIISPTGEIIAMCSTLDDEIAFARCDLDLTRVSKEAVFNFSAHRRPEHYSLITKPKS